MGVGCEGGKGRVIITA